MWSFCKICNNFEVVIMTENYKVILQNFAKDFKQLIM